MPEQMKLTIKVISSPKGPFIARDADIIGAAIADSIKNTNDLEFYLRVTNTFIKESDLCNFLEDNMHLVCREMLNGELKEHKREWGLNRFNRPFGGNAPSIDFMVELIGGERIGIECKNPRQTAKESVVAVSQLLSYAVISESNQVPLNRLCIFSTKYEPLIPQVVKRFNLPIEYWLINKFFHARVEGHG